MAGESTKAVVAAIAGNFAIAVCKFVAAGFSGSASGQQPRIPPFGNCASEWLSIRKRRRDVRDRLRLAFHDARPGAAR